MRNRVPASFRVVTVVSLLLVSIVTCPSLVRAEWVTRSITVGNLPRAIGLNPLTNKVYVPLEDGAAVFVYEPLTDVGGEIAVGVAPCAVAVNPVTNRIYIANQTDNSVSVQHGATNAIIATLSVGVTPYSIAINATTNKIFVACRGGNSVSVIDGATNVVERTLAAGTDAKSVAVNPITNKIYVANRSSNNVTVIDGNTWARSTVTVGSTPNAIAVNPSTNYVYVANQGSNNVTRIDGVTNAKVTIAVGSQPYALTVDPVSNQIYVANVIGNSVTVINGTTNGTTTVAAGTNPVSVAVNSATNRAYVCNLNSDFLTIIDGVTRTGSPLVIGGSGLCAVANALTGRIYVARNLGTGTGLVEIDGTTNQVTSVNVGPGQTSVAVNRRTHRAYVLNGANGLVTEVELTVPATGPLIGVGSSPGAIVTDETHDRIFVANRGDNTVSVIDGSTRVTTSVAVGTAPCALAWDPRGNRLFVVNGGSNDVTIVDGASLTTQSVAVGLAPCAVAFDPVGNACIVVNRQSNTVTVIDAGTYATRTIDVGISPARVAVDPVTHRIFVSNTGRPYPASFPRHVTVIDGATLERMCNVPVTGMPVAMAVDPVRGQVFVADSAGATLTCIRESDWSTRSIPVGAYPVRLELNPWSDRLYVGLLETPQANIVDLNGLATATVNLPSSVTGFAVDERLDKAIASLALVGQAAIVNEVGRPPQPVTATITEIPGHAAAPSQDFSGAAASVRAPNNAYLTSVWVVRDSPGRPWTNATMTSGAGTPSVAWSKPGFESGAPGVHELHAVGLDQTSATPDNNGQCAAGVYVGQRGSYVYTVGSSFVRPPTSGELVVVNVEVDWLVAGDHTHAPSLCELQGVQEAFLRNGYLLNIELGDAITETAANAVINFDDTHSWDTVLGDWHDLESTYRNHAAGTGWHYCIFGHQFDMPDCGLGACPNSGMAELGPDGGGDELLVSLGAFASNVGTAFDRAGTFMHELGHNFGLVHTGGQPSGVGDFKPNYASVMSYRYQLTGVRNGMSCQGLGVPPDSFRELDFSHGTLAPLDENALSESWGLGQGGVDWDCSGSISVVPVAKDISSQGGGGHPATGADWCDANGAKQELQDYDDWSVMRDFTCTPPAAVSVPAAYYPMCTAPLDGPTASAFSCTQPDPCVLTDVTLTSRPPGPLALGRPAPNPSRTGTSLSVTLPVASSVLVTVQDVSGRRVRTLASGDFDAGWHRLSWDGRDTAGAPARPGMYFVLLSTAEGMRTRTVVIVR